MIVSEAKRGRRRHPRWAQRRSFCMHNLQQRIKSLKMVVETSDENKYYYYHVLNPFLKLIRPNHDALWRSIYISSNIIDMDVKFWDNLDSRLEIIVLKFGIDLYIYISIPNFNTIISRLESRLFQNFTSISIILLSYNIISVIQYTVFTM